MKHVHKHHLHTNLLLVVYSDNRTLHFSQVWALAVGKKTEMVATGGGDAVINLWHDSTASDKEDEFRKEVC